jgi:tetratricopeptide (TPR) repeat protein
MSGTADIIRGSAILVVGVLAIGSLIVWSVKKADDPARMIFKWILTAIVVAVLFWKVAPIMAKGGYTAAFGGIPMGAVCGLVLAIIWRHNLAGLVANPFGSLYDGGDTEPEPCPAYSIAQARQKQGKYLEAITEIRKQLDRFPTDVEGHMLLARIQAEDIKDMQAAEITIHRFCEQPGHAPANITFALYSLADWHLQVNHDAESARRALQKILELLPDSEFALGAAQRIAHLAQAEMMLARDGEKRFTVTEGPQNLGLIAASADSQPQQTGAAEMAAEYVKHLTEHPFDTEAREKLAVIYADHYGRLDLAADQLEQMVAQPGQPARLIVHWLNLLADLQIRSGVDYETVKQTLQRIVDLNPKLAAAEVTRNRIALLKLELKAKGKNESVKMGTYEQNIGLRHGGRKEARPVD